MTSVTSWSYLAMIVPCARRTIDEWARSATYTTFRIHTIAFNHQVYKKNARPAPDVTFVYVCRETRVTLHGITSSPIHLVWFSKSHRRLRCRENTHTDARDPNYKCLHRPLLKCPFSMDEQRWTNRDVRRMFCIRIIWCMPYVLR